MRALIARCAVQLDRATHFICLVLTGLIFTSLFAVVMLRYVFGLGFLELQDVAGYAFASLVVVGLPVAYRADVHVRVDIFRVAMSPDVARRFDMAAYFLLVLPVFAITLWHVWPDVAYSWSIREGSRETGGLPGYFIVKAMLPLSCILMLLQGLAMLLAPAGKDRNGG